MKILIPLLILSLGWFLSPGAFAGTPPAVPTPMKKARPSLSPLDAKVNALLSKMTLEEKIGQMVQFSPWKDTEGAMKVAASEGKIGSFLNVFGAKNANE